MKRLLNFLTVSSAVLYISLLIFMPGLDLGQQQEDNYFEVSLNGRMIGLADSEETAYACLRAARRNTAFGSDHLAFADARLTLSGSEVIWGEITPEEELTEAMTSILLQDEEAALSHCYTVKIGTYLTDLASREDVDRLLQMVLDRFDTEGKYVVRLIPDTSRELYVLVPEVVPLDVHQMRLEREEQLPKAGVDAVLWDILTEVHAAVRTDFDDFEEGLVDISLVQTIEVAESYVPAEQVSTVEEAYAVITKDEEENEVYEVRAGDTLSEIAERFHLSLDELIGMNSLLTDPSSLIRPGDALTITVPRPVLSVRTVMQEYYEEDYNADVIYKDNDSWFTNKQVVIQEAAPGHRRVIADVTYLDGMRQEAGIVREEVTVRAVPKIIERGTVPPPTYIWPTSGGGISSGFGRRNAPKAGASTYHQGVDIAVPTGTAVWASSGGTVIVAGWQGGYGNVIYIQHPDGRVTRYGHLSRIEVSPGQKVSQGQRIALSGNTGNSTGPHLHFEIRINGNAVNPLDYLN